jgi:LmbE family N-acetylglucosaminyl deacetylase
MVRIALALSLWLGASVELMARPMIQPDAAALEHAIDGLDTVGTVLYVAAHPDDENTRFLAWLAGERKLRAVYLSMTRGDGGQNLIGTEQAELFGLIRTQELMAARKLDGAEQRFARTKDFGYSKSAEETLRIWGKETALADVVWAIRTVRPDVIVTRFSSSPDQRNHGHHIASAMLAEEAFRLAADPSAFPEQLAHAEVWQADRILYNQSPWRFTPDTDLSQFLSVDVGGYSPLLGRSYGEIAGASRSMHKSQGFGAAQARGPLPEYFTPTGGTAPKADIFEGLDFTWDRFPGMGDVKARIADVKAAWSPKAPHAAIPALLALYDALDAVPDAHWKRTKRDHVQRLIAGCAGLYMETVASDHSAVPGGQVDATVEVINRSPAALELVSVTLPGGARVEVGKALGNNAPVVLAQAFTVPADAPFSNPYWLVERNETGSFTVADPAMVGEPEGPPALSVTYTIRVGGRTFEFRQGVEHKWVDPVEGELYRPFEVVPPVTVNFDATALPIPDRAPRPLRAVLEAGKAGVSGVLRLELPPGFASRPAEVPFALDAKGQELDVVFEVVPPPGKGALTPSMGGTLRAVATVDGREYDKSVVRIDYPHIPMITLHPDAAIPVVPFELKHKAKRIGYIPGAGDTVADNLRQVGYEVDVLTDAMLDTGRLGVYDAIVVGVRAYNTNPRMRVHHDRLMRFVEGGGTLVAQYNTNNRLSVPVAPIGPYPFVIGRGRVTDESAEIVLADPAHPVLTRPNALTPADFEGWVQERGLYFAESWDERYEAPLAMNDPGEAPERGSLLIAKHGKGRVIYTGIAFFRQLPAGVPGAFRLLANLMDHGH